MKITLTIEIDGNNNVVVQSQPVTEEQSTIVKNSKVLNNFGEKLPKGRYANQPRPRTEEYPFNVADAKREMDKADVTISELAKALENFPVVKLRNIFRYDTRRFTKEEYNVILKGIEEVKKSREI